MAAPTANVQNGPSYGQMYIMKPFQTIEVVDLPNVMYNMKSYYASTNDNQGSTAPSAAGTPIANLERRHDDVLKRLEQLQSSVSKLGEKYNVSKTPEPAIQAKVLAPAMKAPSGAAARPSTGSKPLLNTSNGLDLVINVDPGSLPLSLIILCERLSAQYVVLTSTFTHSSVSGAVPEKLQKVLTSNGTKRGDSQIVINLVWKKVAYGPELMVDPTRQTAIQGEVNVARYLLRLLNPSWDQDDIVKATQQDDLLDMAQLQILEGNSKERSAALRTLNSLLGKKSWLDGDEPTIVDICCWSALQQSGQSSSPPANVKKWLALCSQHKFFESAIRLLS